MQYYAEKIEDNIERPFCIYISTINYITYLRDQTTFVLSPEPLTYSLIAYNIKIISNLTC